MRITDFIWFIKRYKMFKIRFNSPKFLWNCAKKRKRLHIAIKEKEK